jgi:hypothetical protein
MNKKIISTLLIAAFAITSTFAVDYGTSAVSTGDSFSSDLIASVDSTSYTLSLKYDGSDTATTTSVLTSDSATTNISVNLTEGDTTGYFAIVASTGNLNKTVDFTTTFTFEAFTGTYDSDQTYTSTSIPSIVSASVPDDQIFSSTNNSISDSIAAGPNTAGQSIATFKLNIPADTAAYAATDYSSTVTMNITTTV